MQLGQARRTLREEVVDPADAVRTRRARVGQTVRLLIIANPISGKGYSRTIWPALQEKLNLLGVEHSVVWTERRGHAISIAREAADSGFTRVLSIGGDGTLREVVQGALTTGIDLGVVPAGSGNDFSRTMGLPKDPLGALDVALGTHVAHVNVGELSGIVYINVAGCGFDAEVAALAASRLRFLGGKLSYLSSVFVELCAYRPRNFRICIDGEWISRRAYLIAVANGRFYGCGMMIAPEADPADGLFDVCIVSAMSRARLVACLPKIYSGSHVDDPYVEMRRGSCVTVETDSPVQCQADGEVVSACPIEFKVSRCSIGVACPADRI